MEADSDGTLRLVEVPRPMPAMGEVLVRVLATSVNRLDVRMRHLAHVRHESGGIPGCDATGVVEALGRGIEGPVPGTLVTVTARPMAIGSGTYAEWVAVPATQVVPVPKGMPPAVATCIAFSGLAAYQGLYALMPESHETVFINGASGAVGTFAIQLAKRGGARVLCNAAGPAGPLCRALGADLMVDGRAEDLGEAVRRLLPNGVEAELDLVDGLTHAGSVRALARRGRIVGLLPVPERSALVDRRLTAWRVDVRPDGPRVAKLLALAVSGHLRAVIADTLPLRAANEAHERLSRGGVHGKLVLQVSEEM